MSCEPAPYDVRRPGIVNRGWTQAIEGENGFVVSIVNRKKCFRAAPVVALASVSAQEFIERFFAAVERFAIMLFADRFFVPCRHIYRFGKARAAANSFAFGAGGFSSRSRTRKLSLAESCT